MTSADSSRAAPSPNFRVLRPSRKAPRAGDVFVVLPPDGLYLFGRVVRTDADAGFKLPLQLIYVFKFRSPVPEMPWPDHLVPAELLFPPVMTNRLPWSRGYFQTIGHRELAPGDTLPTHCFLERLGHGRERFYDEYLHQLPGPVPPVGEWGVHSFRSIDDQVSDALGIGRALVE